MAVWVLPVDGRAVDSEAAQAGNPVAAVDLDGHQAAVADMVAALAGDPVVEVGNHQIDFPTRFIASTRISRIPRYNHSFVTKTVI